MDLDDHSMQPSGPGSNNEPDPVCSVNGRSQLEASHSTPPVSNHVDTECITVASYAPPEVSSQEIPKKRGRTKEAVVKREQCLSISFPVADLGIDPNARSGTPAMDLNSLSSHSHSQGRTKPALEEHSLSPYQLEFQPKGPEASIGLLNFF